MSLILICRKILDVGKKPKLSNIINSFKIHTVSSSKPIILQNSGTRIIAKRTFFNFWKKPKKEELKIIDDIPDHYQLIHRNTLERYILYTQLGTTITAAIVVIVLILGYGNPVHDYTFTGEQAQNAPHSTTNELQVYVGVFCTIVVLLHLLITKMPLRIYYLSSEKKYIMIFPTNIPFNNTRLKCKIGDLEKLPPSGFLPWKDDKFRIKDKKDIFLIEDHFKRPADLWIMLGVQKDPEHQTTEKT